MPADMDLPERLLSQTKTTALRYLGVELEDLLAIFEAVEI